jgi:hypothetical protein
VRRWLKEHTPATPNSSAPKKQFLKSLGSGSTYPPGPYSLFYDAENSKVPMPDLYSSTCVCSDGRLCWHCLPSTWTCVSGANANTVRLQKLTASKSTATTCTTSIPTVNASTSLLKGDAHLFSEAQFAAKQKMCFETYLMHIKDMCIYIYIEDNSLII